MYLFICLEHHSSKQTEAESLLCWTENSFILFFFFPSNAKLLRHFPAAFPLLHQTVTHRDSLTPFAAHQSVCEVA